jgi:hypothetical protein
MTNPITPPPELVGQWRKEPEYTDSNKLVTMVTMTTDRLMQLCEKSAQHGADQELKACCDTLQRHAHWDLAVFELMDDRRPEPPSLKERSLQLLETYNTSGVMLTADQANTIRRALEALPNG